jgi:DNA-binding transcriptional regulator YiaG
MENKPARIALADHIRSMGLKKQDFARMVGVRPDHLSRWLSGKVRPERPACVLIYMLTDGAVPVEAWG